MGLLVRSAVVFGVTTNSLKTFFEFLSVKTEADSESVEISEDFPGREDDTLASNSDRQNSVLLSNPLGQRHLVHSQAYSA